MFICSNFGLSQCPCSQTCLLMQAPPTPSMSHSTHVPHANKPPAHSLGQVPARPPQTYNMTYTLSKDCRLALEDGQPPVDLEQYTKVSKVTDAADEDGTLMSDVRFQVGLPSLGWSRGWVPYCLLVRLDTASPTRAMPRRHQSTAPPHSPPSNTHTVKQEADKPQKSTAGKQGRPAHSMPRFTTPSVKQEQQLGPLPH